MTLQKYNVTGMSCAACQARVEKAVSNVPGVESCAVSLLTNSMGVEGTASAEEIIAAVTKAGYGAQALGKSNTRKAADDIRSEQELMLEDTETPKLKRRLISSVCVLIVLMYCSMGHMMLGLPLPSFLEENHMALGILQMILAAIIMVINGKFFTSGFRSLLHLAPNMDTLVAMGSMTSFVWSVIVLFSQTSAMHDFYFESAAMIVTLITIGKMLEAMSKGKTTDALKSLMKLTPQTAIIETASGEELEIPIDELAVGDIFVVRPGASIPVDGIIIEGSTAVNESALTGESLPVDKTTGDIISAATVNTSGFIKARATRVGEDTTLSQIIQMVSDAAATKAPIAKIADKVSGIFVPVVIGIAICVIIIWLLLGADVGYALARGIAVLVISCPCALGLATPVAIMVGNGIGAKNGILFKTAASLEAAGRTEIIALDKTGTITRGEPVVTDIEAAEGVETDELLRYAASLEFKSEHPIAQAITAAAEERHLDLIDVEEFAALPGHGLTADLSGKPLTGGSLSFISESATIPDEIITKSEELASQGKTPMLFTLDNRLLGIIAVADTIKEDSPEAVRQLRGMGIHVVMLTGDNEKTARAIGQQVGVDEVIAGVLPSGKESTIRKLGKRGKIAMVGDGINDAPALTRADTGIAIGTGADVAIDAADVVLMNSSLMDAVAAIRLSRATIRNIHENLFWAFFYNVLLIPLAAGAYVHLMGGWSMSPVLGAAAMSISSFCVCMNALRLNTIDIRNAKKDKKIKPVRNDRTDRLSNEYEEEITMKKTMNIEGMMCMHCEAAVKKALEALDGVDEAIVSHEAGTAVVEMSDDVSDEALTKAVEDKDYKVISVE